MRDAADEALAAAAPRFNMLPLVFETFACTLAMMAFVALVGPIARVLGLAPWQAGTAVTVGGIAWVLLARMWGAASDRHGRRRILLRGPASSSPTWRCACSSCWRCVGCRRPGWPSSV